MFNRSAPRLFFKQKLQGDFCGLAQQSKLGSFAFGGQRSVLYLCLPKMPWNYQSQVVGSFWPALGAAVISQNDPYFPAAAYPVLTHRDSMPKITKRVVDAARAAKG